MIQFSAAIQALLQEPVVEAFYLVRIGVGFNKTTFYSDLGYDGVTYVSDGSILSVEPPQLTSVVDKQNFKLTIADSLMELGSAAETSLLGTSVEVRVGFVDQLTKQPLLGLTDTLLVYKGVVDSSAYAIDTSTIGSTVFNISCSSPMADLDLKRTYYTSQDYSDKNFPGDTAYSQIYEAAGPINLKWGKT